MHRSLFIRVCKTIVKLAGGRSLPKLLVNLHVNGIVFASHLVAFFGLSVHTH